MKPRSIFLLVVLLGVTIFFIIRFASGPTKQQFDFYPMGGIPCRIVATGVSPEEFVSDMKSVENLVRDLEHIFSRYQKDSEVLKLNDLPKGIWHHTSPEMYTLLDRSLEWYGRTGGAFDVTVTPVLELWKKASEAKVLPDEKEIRSALRHVGSTHITISSDNGIRFSRNGMKLDFGGIAKGYILDQIDKMLADYERSVISCGGDVVMRGDGPFRVGIQEPFGKTGNLMMIINIPAGAVVTSGHYERYYEIDLKKYSHIVDPKTGRPVENDLISITVAAENGTDADALATAIAVLGFEKSVGFLSKTDNFSAVLLQKVKNNYEIHYSKKLSGNIQYKGRWNKVVRKEF